jgi:hypothetical protein
MTYFSIGAITAAQLEAVVPRIGLKTSTQTVNNSTTLVSDSQLFVTVAANTNYVFTSRFLYTTGATPNIKFAFTYPVLATATYTLYGVAAGGAGLGAFHQTETSVGALDDGTATACTMTGTWMIGANAGTVQLQWAQNTNNASNTQVLAGSFIRFDQVVAT